MEKQTKNAVGSDTTTDFVEIGRPSLFFHEINDNTFGKESLGLLPENFGRDSIFSNTFRESLGILNITMMDVGRESLLTLPSTRCLNNAADLPSFSFTFDDKETSNDLNVGFIDDNVSKTSSSYSANNFHSMSLEGPSTIYSVSQKTFGSRNSEDLERKISTDLSPHLKISVTSSLSSIHSPLNRARLLSAMEISDIRTRIKSLPVHIEEGVQADNEMDISKRNLGAKFWSAEKITKTKSMLRRSFHDTHGLDFDEKDEKDFNDSVFIEANHLAYKFANNSIYEEDNDDVSSISIEFPEMSNVEVKKDHKPKPDTEAIFKTVDKLLIPNADVKIKIKSSKSESSSSNEVVNVLDNVSTASNKEDHSQNLSKLSQISEKDPLKILKNLSEILCVTDQLSRSQKSESQNMINNLASILSEPRGSNDLEDSGHSSIEEPFECPLHNQLGISPQATSNDKNLQSNSIEVNRLKLSTKNRPAIKVYKNSSNTSASSNDRSSSSNFSSRPLMVNKGKPKEVKKGPMKAIVPMPGMTKKKSGLVTPNKQSELTVQKEMNSKRTSTPIHEPKLKPMAASTPASLPTKNVQKMDVSPLARPRISNYSFTRPKNTQGIVNRSLTSFAKESKKMVRSNSVSEPKTSLLDENIRDLKYKRSNSVGKETGLMTALSKVRKSIISSPYYKQTNPEVLSENRRPFISSLPKPSNLAVKIKSAGKENIEN